MSRIDEARRRAEGSGPDDAQALMPLAALQSEGNDAIALAQEDYPAESTEGKRITRPSGAAPRPLQPCDLTIWLFDALCPAG